MAMSFLYDFSSSVTEPPTSSQIRFDSADPATVTRLWIRSLTTDGIDAHRLLLAQPVSQAIYVQDKNDHTLASAFTLAAAPVDKSTYVEWPVAFLSTTGAPLLNNQAVLLLALEPAGVSPTPPTPGMSLVTLAELKLQLRITTPADDPGDAALTQQGIAAEALILDYCNSTVWWRGMTPSWTSATVPLVVKAAILTQAAEFYRFRGDDVEREGPAREAGVDLAPRVVELLRRHHDPVVV